MHTALLNQSYRNAVLNSLGLTATWSQSDISGTVAKDDCGKSDGVYNTAPTLGVTGVVVGGGTAVRYASASGDYISVAFAGPGDVFTLAAWVKRTTAGAVMGLFSGATGSWYFYFDSDNTIVLDNQGVANNLTTTATFADTADWHLVAVSKDGAARGIYYDGVVQATTGGNSTLSAPSSFQIARKTDAINYLNGTLHRPTIWSRSLAAAEHASLYRMGRGF